MRIYSPAVDGEVTYAVEVSWDGAVFVFRLVRERPSPELFVATIDDVGES